MPKMHKNRRVLSEIQENALRKMKPKQAEVLIAIHVDGKNQSDYAKEIGVNQSNVSRRLHTAENIFKRIFSKTA